MVERLLCMHEAPRSMLGISTTVISTRVYYKWPPKFSPFFPKNRMCSTWRVYQYWYVIWKAMSFANQRLWVTLLFITCWREQKCRIQSFTQSSTSPSLCQRFPARSWPLVKLAATSIYWLAVNQEIELHVIWSGLSSTPDIAAPREAALSIITVGLFVINHQVFPFPNHESRLKFTTLILTTCSS